MADTDAIQHDDMDDDHIVTKPVLKTPTGAWIGFSIYEADGSGYTKRWSWPEGKYLGRIDEKVK